MNSAKIGVRNRRGRRMQASLSLCFSFLISELELLAMVSERINSFTLLFPFSTVILCLRVKMLLLKFYLLPFYSLHICLPFLS